MEQVLAPNFNFKPKSPEGSDEDKADDARTIRVGGMRQPSTQNVKNILDSDLTDLKANILQDPQIAKAVSGVVDPEVINKIMIPKIIMTKYPHLSEDEVEEVREHLVADMVIRGSNVKTDGNAEACNNIEALFGEKAEEFGFRKIEPRETVEELCQLAEFAARGYLRQASIKLSGTITATIAAKPDKIEISRKTTSSQKLEAKMMV